MEWPHFGDATGLTPIAFTPMPSLPQVSDVEAMHAQACDHYNAGLRHVGHDMLWRAATLARRIDCDSGRRQSLILCLTTAALPVCDHYGSSRAFRLLTLAEKLATREDHPASLAICTLARLKMSIKRENYRAALHCVERLAGSLDAFNDRQKSTFHTCAGIAYSNADSPQKAFDHCLRALEFTAEPDSAMTAIQKGNLAQAAYVQGDTPLALALLAEIRHSVSTVHALKGQIYADVGLVEEAVGELERALADPSLPGNTATVVALQLAQALSALGLSARTSPALTRMGGWSATAHEALQTAPDDDSSKDVEFLTDMMSATRKRGDRYLLRRLHLSLAYLHATKGNVESASQFLDCSNFSFSQESLAQILQFLCTRALIAWHTGEVEHTEASIVEAITHIAERTSTGVGLDVAAAAGTHALSLSRLHSDLVSSLGRRHGQFAVAEEWRLASQWRPDPALGPGSDVSDALVHLRSVMTSLADLSPQAHAHQVAEARERVVHAVRRNPTPSRTPRLRPITPDVLREAADRLRHRVSMFLTRGDDLHVLDPLTDRLTALGPVREVGRLAEETNQAVAAAARGGPPGLRAASARRVAALAERLDAALGRPGDGTDRVLIVPHQHLFLVPWGVLPSLRGVAVTVSRTATQWHASLHEEASSPARVFVGVGPDLTHGIVEAAAVAHAWPGATLDRAASSETVRQALDRSEVVHIAAHGLHHRSSPLFSQVNLHDGPFCGYDVVARPCPTRLLILSGCEVGGTSPRPLDHPLGLATAALYAGVTCVIAPVTPVADAATASMMGRLHQGLAAGLSGAEALAATNDPGSFVCFGSWTKVAS